MMPLVGGVATTMALVALSTGTAFADADDSGTAYAARVDATLLNTVTAKLAPQPVASYHDGKGSTKSVDTIQTPQLKADLLEVFSDHKEGKLFTEAHASVVDVLGLVKATLIQSTCTDDQDGVHGDSKFVEASALGIKLDPKLPQKIELLGGAVTVLTHEQIKDADGSLTINALHVIISTPLKDIAGGIARANVVVSQAKCAANHSAAEAGGDTPPAVGLPPVVAPSSSAAAPSSKAPTSVTPTAPSSAVARPKLPNTGADVTWLAGGAVLLLGAGAGALWWTRRRSAQNNA